MKLFKISLLFFSLSHLAHPNDVILKKFEDEERKINPQFKTFSRAEGEKIFRTERINSKGEKISCMTCHTSDPKAEGLSRANKVIAPIARVVNKERFTDIAKVEKWFKRNCKDVLDRECTNSEKGHFTIYMISVK